MHSNFIKRQTSFGFADSLRVDNGGWLGWASVRIWLVNISIKKVRGGGLSVLGMILVTFTKLFQVSKLSHHQFIHHTAGGVIVIIYFSILVFIRAPILFDLEVDTLNFCFGTYAFGFVEFNRDILISNLWIHNEIWEFL